MWLVDHSNPFLRLHASKFFLISPRSLGDLHFLKVHPGFSKLKQKMYLLFSILFLPRSMDLVSRAHLLYPENRVSKNSVMNLSLIDEGLLSSLSSVFRKDLRNAPIVALPSLSAACHWKVSISFFKLCNAFMRH